MKRCPECRRDYHDETLSYCLEDGAALVSGIPDDPVTALFDLPPRGHSRNNEITKVLEAEDTSVGPPEGATPNRFDKRLVLAPMLVAVIAVGGFFAYQYLKQTSHIDSIAVMPFVNESGNAEVDYLSDGMTESLITSLTQLPDLNVKPSSSTFRYKGRESEIKTIGSELKVRVILNGRLIQRGEEVTLFLALIDTNSENQIWGKQYNRKLASLVALQNEVARDVLASLRTRSSGIDERNLTKAYTSNPEAYRLYLQGRFFWNKRGPQNLQKAVGYFQQAIALDPDYALAYSGIADAYASGDSKSLEYAMKALTLDDSLAEAHTSLGTALLREKYDFSGAERAYRRAAELNPNYAPAHQFYCRLLDAVARHDEADAEIRRALELEPMSLPINWFYGIHLYVIRDYEASVTQLRRTVELDPSFVNGQISLGDALVLNGKFAEAVEQLARQQELQGRPAKAAFIRETCAGVSWQECWRALTDGNSSVELGAFVRARMFAELGDKDKAFSELEKSYEQREAPFLRLKVDPRLDGLRADPRYAELVKKTGFPE
jgi:TolB-like protein/Tfp pilus assembly protein PilF